MRSTSFGRRGWRWPASVFVVAVGASLTLVAGIAPASPVTPPPPASTIVDGPAADAVTNAASITFAYTNTQSGVGFQCAIDSGTYASCPTEGKTYTELGDGSHTFKVAATAGDSDRGAADTRTFVLDRTAPTITVTGPAEGATLNADAWSAVCTNAPGLCGTATDAHGVAKVSVAIRQTSTGRYWTGAAFTTDAVTYLDATGTTTWALSVPARPSDGGYTASIRAFDTLGNATALAGPVGRTFSVDTAGPSVVEWGDVPDTLTTRTTARITWFATGILSETPTYTFQCKLDVFLYRACASPFSATKLKSGQHCLLVKAIDSAGNAGEPAQTCWSVVLDSGFKVTGNLGGTLTPGVAATVDLVIDNPFAFEIKIVGVTTVVAATTTKAAQDVPGCNGVENFEVTRQLEATSVAIVVPARSTKTLSELGVASTRWPEVTMRALDTEQSACMGTTIQLQYAGSALQP